MVRKGYRNPPYHNWIHAFTVAHFCYLLYKNAKISSRLRLVQECDYLAECCVLRLGIFSSPFSAIYLFFEPLDEDT